jgi:hypothetical protein
MVLSGPPRMIAAPGPPDQNAYQEFLFQELEK